jgi:hypothetical protein
MPVIQGRTREQLRQHIGYALGALHVSSASSNGTTGTLVDNTLVIGGDDTFNGKWIRFTSGDDDGAIRRVTDYTASSYTLTLLPALSASSTSGDTYEMWDDEYPPARIDDFINQAILDATGQAYDPIENISLHGDGYQKRFDIPSNIDMIRRVEYRNKVSSARLHACGSTFDEATDSDFTQSLDTKDKKQGTQSLKLVIASGASAGDFVSDSITSKDISGYDTIEMWVKSTVATSAGNLKLLLDDTASCASPLETLSIPALSADTWTFVRMSLSNPETDTAIISVGLEYDADLGACTVWIDDIVAVANDTAEWEVLDRRNWKIDKEARDLILLRDGHQALGYSLIKIIGGDKPALLSADSSTTEVGDTYIIAMATTLALISSSGGTATDPDSKRQLSAYWAAQAERERNAFPMLVGVRTVS